MMQSFTVGRGSNADIQLSDDSISRLHLKVTIINQSHCQVEDLGSSNGTFLVQDNQSHRLSEAEIEVTSPLVIGEYHTTISDLLYMLKQKPRQIPTNKNTEPYSRYIRSEDGRYVRKSK